MDIPILQEHGWIVVDLPDRVNAASLKDVDEVVKPFLAGDEPVRLLYDFSQVKYIDSTGIGSLIRLLGALKAKKGVFALVNCRDHVLKIFRLVNLQRYLKVFSSRGEAYQSEI